MLIVRCVPSGEVQRKGFKDDLVKSHLKDLLSKETILIRKGMKGKKNMKTLLNLFVQESSYFC